MNWTELSEDEKIKQVYSKYTIKDFWDWWSDNKPKVMEVRIKDINLIKETSKKFRIPYSTSGVYVDNHLMLKNVIAYVRDKATVWFGVQPRKKNWNKWGNKSYGSGPNGGTADVNVDEIGFIFLDIDRVHKDGPATNKDLENADILANKILERLSTENWNKGYVKICSGNGLQLIIKLDFPITMPNAEFETITNGKAKPICTRKYIEHDRYDIIRTIVAKGVGNQILKFCRKFKKDLNVEIDKSGFSLSRVAALPVTKNFKFDGYTWRGIVELKNESNVGLSDYVLSIENDEAAYSKKPVFIKELNKKNFLVKGSLSKHKLIRFMLDNDLPYGSINNKLWFQLKCLVRDCGINVNSDEFRKIHKKLEIKVKGALTLNLPDPNFSFDEHIVNSYCIEHCIPPLYDIVELFKKTRKGVPYIDMSLVTIRDIDDPDIKTLKLSETTTILEDVDWCKTKMRSNNITHNINIIFPEFMKGVMDKYGEQKTIYYFKYLLEPYFNYELNEYKPKS